MFVSMETSVVRPDLLRMRRNTVNEKNVIFMNDRFNASISFTALMLCFCMTEKLSESIQLLY